MANNYEMTPTREADEMHSNTAQRELRDALTKKDLKYFEIALDMGADPLMPIEHNRGGACVYEIALSTCGYGQFVQLCLDSGCSPYYINQQSSKAAINYAVDSKDPEIIKLLLRHPYVKVNRKLSPLSPINSLIINANNDNVDNIIACLKCLLKYGSRIHIPDQSKRSPFYYLEQNQQLTDADQKYKIQQVLYHYTAEKNYTRSHDDVYPMVPVNGHVRELSVFRSDQPKANTFLNVNCGNLDKFKQQFAESELSENDKVRLLLESIEEDKDDILDFLLENRVDYNGKFDDMSPLLFAVAFGNSYALKRLLDQDNLDLSSVQCPLSMAILEMHVERERSLLEHRRCFYLLLKCDDIDINERDNDGITALFWAICFHIDEAIRELLKRGAYIGISNLEDLNPKYLQECFDNSISANDIWGDDFKIRLTYDNIRAPLAREKSKHRLDNEMATLAFIAESKKHRYLLQHPLISIFLFLKWRQLSFVFYTNLVIYVIFALSFMLYTTLRFSSWETEAITTTAWSLSWLGIVYMLLREILQFLKSPDRYFCSAINYVELLIIILAIVSCTDDRFHVDTQKMIAVCTMLLIAVELFLLLGYLPVLSMSTHMLMLEAVCLTFLKSFMLYSVFLITFSTCFYTLFNRGKIDAEGNALPLDETDGDDSSNQFSSPLKTVIKTIVMMTGEFDAGDIEFNTFYSYLVFLLFVFLMTIVMYNLLNGLAVSDIQALKGQAELNGAICRTKWLARNEGNLIGHSKLMHFLLNLKWLRPICQRFLHRYPRYRQIDIVVERSIIEFIFNDADDDDYDGADYTEYTKIDPEMTKMIIEFLEQNRKNVKQPTNHHMHGIENRLNDIDNRIEQIFEMLKTLQNEKS